MITWGNNPRTASYMAEVWKFEIWIARTARDVFLKIYWCCLNDENFRTLLAETEGIINSRPLTVETLRDVNNHIPLSLSDLLTWKTNVVLPPPGNFDRPGLCSRRRWRQMQHVAGQFGSGWRNNFIVAEKRLWQEQVPMIRPVETNLIWMVQYVVLSYEQLAC